MLKRIKAIEGKTIKTAEHGGGDFTGCDNRTLQLCFTDGTTFCLDIESELTAEAIFYRAPNGKGQKVYQE